MTVDIAVACLGGFILFVGLGSNWLERHGLPPTVLALLAGFLVGPGVMGWLDVEASGQRAHILEVAARLSLGMGVVSLVLFVPKVFPREHWWDMMKLIGLSMVLMWGISTAVVHHALGLPWALSAVLGAAVTPTDPVAARPIICGSRAEEELPDRVRHILAFESGANGGLSYLFIFLPFLILTMPSGKIPAYYLIHTMLWEVIAGTLIGLAFGALSGWLLKGAAARDLISSDWRLVSTAAMALLAVGVGHLLEVDELMCAFAAGLGFTQVVDEEEREEEELGHETASRFLAVPVFGMFGMTLPVAGWREMGWGGVMLVAGLLLLRRVPVFLLIRPLLKMVRHRRDALFIGWFGPIGVDTIYYGTLMEQRLENPIIWNVVSLVICSSILIHGLTAMPLTLLYGWGRRRDPDEEAPQAEREAREEAERKEREPEPAHAG